ncbi:MULTISPECIES: dihydroneopterin aldolase [Idiomarinaceae]|uniref:7,8-dihydroneopterin aldolase n=4 Tax=Pseudidiomarina TaxID=2800384 RepID=A0A368UNB7_9GAMM|nr:MULTISPECIES: dihydroneopterin aldolase [Idiomarinaceae]MDT7526269.1 dihydroneopterin aldolase [Pseudidiomarina sp. GXY010]MDX1526541.1 dihydroneopterin aldolase [Pseudidiomarina maritima]MRJ43057.1 dihydroneopterin aldolase [Idiomarina sp. FeN1]NCU58240.1 dihydroneopterin aldolase [Idiomarina sp. FenA--70]NCU60938.1 dihydroneopterin aldolase [Idiomarina sp. FenBw--71]
MDKVFVEGLVVDAYIGVYDWEHESTQPLVLDLTMAWDNAKAARSEDLADALDYDSLSKAVTALIQQRPRALIETVAEEVAELILTHFKVPQVTVKVGKPQAVKAARQTAVEITRKAS